jgi:magnesium-transporting ATPase (P-type)
LDIFFTCWNHFFLNSPYVLIQIQIHIINKIIDIVLIICICICMNTYGLFKKKMAPTYEKNVQNSPTNALNWWKFWKYHGTVVYFGIFWCCFFPWYKGSLRDNYFNRNCFIYALVVEGDYSRVTRTSVSRPLSWNVYA